MVYLPKNRNGRGRPPRNRIFCEMALMLSRQGWPLKRIQDHLNAYLSQEGPKRQLIDEQKGYSRGAARYRDAGAASLKKFQASVRKMFEDGLLYSGRVDVPANVPAATPTRPQTSQRQPTTKKKTPR